MHMFKSRKKRLEVDNGNSNDFTVMDFVRDVDGHKKDIQQWGESLRNFSFFEEPEIFTGVYKGICRGKSFQEDDKETPEMKQLHEMRKKLLKKRNLERKKRTQSQVEIVRSLSTLSSTRKQRGRRKNGNSSLNRTRSESRDLNSLRNQKIFFDERDCNSDVLEGPCYFGSFEDTFEKFDVTDDFRKPEKNRVTVQQGLKKRVNKNKNKG